MPTRSHGSSSSWVLVAVLAGCHPSSEHGPPHPPPQAPPPTLAEGDDPSPHVEPPPPDRQPPTTEELDLVGDGAGHACLQWLGFDGTSPPPPDHACGFAKMCRGQGDEAYRQAYARVSWAILDNPAVIEASVPAWIRAQQCAAVMSDPDAVARFTLERAEQWERAGSYAALLQCAETCELPDAARDRLLVLEDDRARVKRIREQLARMLESIARTETLDDLAQTQAQLDAIEAEVGKLRRTENVATVREHLTATASSLETMRETMLEAEHQRFPATMQARLDAVRDALDGVRNALRTRRAHRFDVLYGRYSEQPLAERIVIVDEALERARDALEHGARVGLDTESHQQELSTLEDEANALRERAAKRYAQLERVSPLAKQACDLAHDGVLPRGKDRARWNALKEMIRRKGLTPPQPAQCYMK